MATKSSKSSKAANPNEGEAQNPDPVKGEGISKSILFTATLRNPFDQYLEGKLFTIEIFDAKAQQWSGLAVDLPISKGMLQYDFPYLVSGKAVGEWGARVAQMIEFGSFPQVRLVHAPSVKSEWTEVLAFGGLLAPRESGATGWHLHFGNLWVLDGKTMHQHLDGEQPAFEYTVAAVPRPRGNHTLFPALQAALTNPEAFEDFKAGEGKPKFEGTEKATTQEGEPAKTSDALFLANQQLQLQQSEITRLNEELRLKNQLIAAKDSELQQKQVSVDQLQQSVDAGQTKAAPVNQIYKQLVEEVNTASKATKADENNAFTLGAVKLNLKTFVRQDDDGMKFQLVDAGTANQFDQNYISDLTIDVVGQEPEPVGNTPSIVVPRVTGLTETAARKRLKQFGYRMEAIYQSSENQIVGQAFKQTPVAGDDLPSGETITVIFAKAAGSFA